MMRGYQCKGVITFPENGCPGLLLPMFYIVETHNCAWNSDGWALAYD